jgi:2-amino-4-hydroxy-6-hydroxymethyldihydropteridine diphosphokinase
MFPVIDLGPFAIQAPGLILILSFLLGSWLIDRMATALGTNGDVIENSLLIGLVAGILSARIGFLLQNPSVFSDNPMSLLSLTPSMLNPGFGLLAGVLGAFITAQRKHLPLWPTLDTLTPFVLILFIGLQLANLANGDVYGLPTALPWGIRLWGEMRHPVQIYAILLALGVVIWFLIRTKGLSETGFLRSGVLSLITIAALAAITIFTRAFVAEKLLLWRHDLLQLAAFVLLLFLFFSIFRKGVRKQGQVHVFISMGSNRNPLENLERGLLLLSEEFTLLRFSSRYQTADIRPEKSSKPFLNQALELKTELSYPLLRKKLKSIEKHLGRERGNKDVVPLDLDILTYDQDVFVFSGHHIPDPLLIKYHYMADPLAEIAPDFRHPADGRSIQQILKAIVDQTQVKKLNEVENGTQR